MQILEKVKGFVAQLIAIANVILKAVVPVGLLMVGCDIIIGTNFGILQAITQQLSVLGITGNSVTILAITIIVLYYEHKKK